MNDEEVKKNRTMEFLKQFLDRTAFGSKEGRQLKYDESKKNIFGFPLPEFGVSEFLNMPNLSEAKQKIEDEKKEKIEEEKQKDLGDSVDLDKFFKQTRNTMLTETLLREFENRMQNRRDLNLISQTMPIIDTYAETAAQRRLMEDRSSPTKISQQRLRAQTGEAALMQAIANQTAAAAQAGTIGTSRRYGR